MMEECIFCKIVSGKIPCSKIMEDNTSMCFLDISPANPGHCLVIPKKHHQQLFEIPADELSKLMITLQKIAAQIKNATGCKGLNILMNNGSVAGQVVMHAHFHIIPRYEGDGLNFSWTPKNYKGSEMRQMLERITGTYTG